MKLLDDIFFSSATAIDILNDLLQYENIDAGKFKLEFKTLNLRSIFQQRLNPYVFMASKKNVTVDIIDDVGVSEFFNYSFQNSQLDIENSGANVSKSLDSGLSDNNSSVSSNLLGYQYKDLFLNVDLFRIDQIIRNLITNALKVILVH